MTFSLLKLLFVVPAFIAVGVAAACEPYIGPICKPPSCISMPAPAYPPPRVCVPAPRMRVVYEYQAAPGVPGTSLAVLDGKIQVQTADGARMSAEKLTILVSGVEPAEVVVVGTQIKISSGKDVKGGDFFQASAQNVTRIGAEGATLVLEGDAKLLYVRQGKKIDVSTDLLSVNLSTGQVISELEMKPVQPLPQDTPTPVPPIQPQTGRAPTTLPRGTTAVPPGEPERGPDRRPRP